MFLLISYIKPVIQYYTSTASDYELVWNFHRLLNRNSVPHLHLGFHDKSAYTHSKALERMCEVIAKTIDIKQNDIVGDLGCGYGGTSIWLTRNKGCRVVSITLVPLQASSAHRFAKRFNVGNIVHPCVADFMSLPLVDESLTKVVMLESLFHSPDKVRTLSEAHRTLKTNGEIVIADFTLKDGLTPEDENLIKPWLQGWAATSLLTPSTYRSALLEAGFTDIEIFDVTKYVSASVSRLSTMSRWAMKGVRFWNKAGNFFSQGRVDNIQSSITQGEAFKKGIALYTIVRARKRINL